MKTSAPRARLTLLAAPPEGLATVPAALAEAEVVIAASGHLPTWLATAAPRAQRLGADDLTEALGTALSQRALGRRVVVLTQGEGELSLPWPRLLTTAPQPLAGRRVVLTRTHDANRELAALLEADGAEVVEIPLTTTRADASPKAKEVAAEAFAELGSYDWIAFTSANGVRYFFQTFFKAFGDLRALGGARLAAVGPATARALEKLHLRVDVKPGEHHAAALAAAMAADGSLDNLKVLVVTGNLNRDTLVKLLEAERAIVDLLPVYLTEPTDLAHDAQARAYAAHGADAIVFASSSAVEAWVAGGPHLARPATAPRPACISLGAETSKSLRAAGLEVAAEAAQATPSALAAAVRQALAGV